MPLTFPVAELEFSNIIRTVTRTRTYARLYRVDDGGLNLEGHQLYDRTLKRQRQVSILGELTDAELVTLGRQEVTDWALEEFGFALPPERLICSL